MRVIFQIFGALNIFGGFIFLFIGFGQENMFVISLCQILVGICICWLFRSKIKNVSPSEHLSDDERGILD